MLEGTTDDARALETVCAEIAGELPKSLLQEELAVARVAVGDVEHRSAEWQAPVVALRSSIFRGTDVVGFVEVGYREIPNEGQPEADAFLEEEQILLDGVAAHVGRMLHHRRMEETLRQSQRLESIGHLTGGIAHDFNNLLTVMRGNAELLVERLGEDSPLGPLAAMIDSAAQRGAELTGRLLAFARKQALDPHPVDVNDLVHGVQGLLGRTLGEDVEVEVRRGVGLWPALVDRGQLESALLNLCLNARDAMPGGGRLVIETANVELDEDYAGRYDDVQPGSYVLVGVTDTGVGMAAEHLERVFEPFFATKKKGKGTGLGLSMVYGFVKQSRGHIAIDSERGRGTSVRLYLPRSSRADEPVTQIETATGVELTGG